MKCLVKRPRDKTDIVLAHDTHAKQYQVHQVYVRTVCNLHLFFMCSGVPLFDSETDGRRIPKTSIYGL